MLSTVSQTLRGRDCMIPCVALAQPGLWRPGAVVGAGAAGGGGGRVSWGQLQVYKAGSGGGGGGDRWLHCKVRCFKH